MIIVLNITDKVEDLDKNGQNWQNWIVRTKLVKITKLDNKDKICQNSQNWTKRTKLDNIRELDSMMNKLKKNMNCLIQI